MVILIKIGYGSRVRSLGYGIPRTEYLTHAPRATCLQLMFPSGRPCSTPILPSLRALVLVAQAFPLPRFRRRPTASYCMSRPSPGPLTRSDVFIKGAPSIMRTDFLAVASRCLIDLVVALPGPLLAPVRLLPSWPSTGHPPTLQQSPPFCVVGLQYPQHVL